MKYLPVVVSLLFATVALAQQPTAATHKKTSGSTNCGQLCGTERWAAKTLSDADSASLNNATASDSSVASLIVETPPAKLPASGRVPLEKKLFHVQAVFLGFKSEADHDFHIVIADPSDLSKQMIAEIPDSACQAACSSAFSANFTAARKTVVQKLGKPPRTKSVTPLKKAWLVEITGPAFFDFDHGQDGLAPNCIEMHPLLEITFVNEVSQTAPIHRGKDLAHHCGAK